MYMAEIHHKLAKKYEGMEDILTSNVFSFFKYSSRTIFLKGFLNYLGLPVTEAEAKSAEFTFWPRFSDGTEPDLILLVGDYYLLVEAKYFSDFGMETEKTKAQLVRELENGRLDANSSNKIFKLIAITEDYRKKEQKLKDVPAEFRQDVIWTKWQQVSSFLYEIVFSSNRLENTELAFAQDLYLLLEKKKLRDFRGSSFYPKLTGLSFKDFERIFFEVKSATHRGEFVGFSEVLQIVELIKPAEKFVFFDNKRRFYALLENFGAIEKHETTIFFKGGEHNA
jgi:hypothetical protein